MIICRCQIDNFIKEITGREETDVQAVQITIENGVASDLNIIHDGSGSAVSYFYIGTIIMHNYNDDALFSFEHYKAKTSLHQTFTFHQEIKTPFFNKIKHHAGEYQATFVGYKICITN